MDYTSFENLLKVNHTTVYRVSKQTGIAGSTFTDWKKGRSRPKADKMCRIAAYFGMSLDEFLGQDERLPSRPAADGLNERSPYVSVPVVREIRAGSLIVTNETLIGSEIADVSDPDDYFYLRISDTSMRDCGMVSGALVLFRKQQYAESGSIVACLTDSGSAVVRRFFKEGKHLSLHPENAAYDTIALTPEDFESGRARILGVATEIRIKL